MTTHATTTTALPRPLTMPRRPNLLWIVGILALLTFGFLISHAVERHADDALAARECFGKDNYELYFNPVTRYAARTCITPDGENAVQVFKWMDGRWEELTAYIYRNGKDVVLYLVETGFVALEWLP